MPLHSLFPSYYVINYHSELARHKMTLPTRAWNSLGGTGGSGGFTAWDESNRDAIEMIVDLVALLVVRHGATVVYDDWTIYNIPVENGPAFPVAAGVFTGATGEDSSPGWYKAVQATFSFFDTAFNESKVVLLDAASDNGFDRRSIATYIAAETDVATEWMLDSNAWASRAGFQPVTFRTVTYTINNALRKRYGFT